MTPLQTAQMILDPQAKPQKDAALQYAEDMARALIEETAAHATTKVDLQSQIIGLSDVIIRGQSAAIKQQQALVQPVGNIQSIGRPS